MSIAGRFALPLMAALLTLAGAEPARADRIDDIVGAQMKKQHIPGVSIAVLRDGKPIKTKGYGLANLELGTPATPETVYQIGSVSKQFIAAGVVLLAGDGKLTLDEPVTKYLDDAPAAWRAVTLKHLLTHTSGLVRDTPDLQMKSQTVLEAIRGAYATPLAFPPGEKLQYSNIGYFVLAEVITRAAGTPWPQFMQQRVFAPLGMTATRTTTNDDLVPRRASGYLWSTDRYVNAQNPAGVRPSGAFLSTVQDLARWDQALRDDRLFTAKQRELLWTPVTVNDGSTQPYGLGWEISRVGEHRLVRHGGSMMGFRSDLSRYLDDGLTVVVLTNSGVSLPEKISGSISASLIEGLQPRRVAARLPASELDGFTGTYRMAGGELSVEREGDRLSVSAARGPIRMQMAVLTRESTTTFFDEDNTRSTFTLEPDAQGRMQLVMKNEAGRVLVQATRER